MATTNQKIVIDRIKKQVGKGGKISVSKAMQGVYSPSVAKNPSKLTKTKAWAELMEEFLPETEIARHHKELLNQTRIEYFTFAKTMSDEEITQVVEEAGLKVINISYSDKGKLAFYSTADAQARKAALDMAHKLRGTYEDTKNSASKTLIVNANGITFKKFGTDSK